MAFSSRDRYGRARPLAPNTASTYRRTLERAFGDIDPLSFTSAPSMIQQWPLTMRRTLAKAVIRHGRDTDREGDAARLVRSIPFEWAIKRAPIHVSLVDVEKLEAAIEDLPERPRLLLWVLLFCGFRVHELIVLTREQIERATETGTLTYVAKGGVERTFPVGGVRTELRRLLTLPTLPSKCLGVEAMTEAMRHDRAWETVGQLVGANSAAPAQARQLSSYLKRAAREARLDPKRWSPHKLRHAFATRAQANGASPRAIQIALGHASLTTTQGYLHADEHEIDQIVRAGLPRARKRR